MNLRPAIDLIKKFEGLSLKAYLCPAKVWTIGYGHTGNVNPKDEINEAQAEEMLVQDLQKFVHGLEKALGSVKLSDNQFCALLSFVYNVGLRAFEGSTLLRKLKQGYSYESCADEFPKWNKAGGRVLAGLIRRRSAEAELFMLDVEGKDYADFVKFLEEV